MWVGECSWFSEQINKSQATKMTPRLLHICGCEICIIPKYNNISLNKFRQKLVTFLKCISVGRHTHNIAYSNTRVLYYNDKVFPVGECLHDTNKDVYKSSVCYPIKPKNIIHMKCDLLFFDKFTKWIIPDEELDDGPHDTLVIFSYYTYQLRLGKHGIIRNEP